ncbi:MAG: hypothetical protein JXA60_09970 [Candidatus Coatesbacteria bacterium]|nr:hypothetical protein [Candidatus Coatesbacteria bacterium]
MHIIPKENSLRFLILFSGFLGFSSQILLFRLFMENFGGIEFVLIFSLGSWLLGNALGSKIFNAFSGKIKQSLKTYINLHLISIFILLFIILTMSLLPFLVTSLREGYYPFLSILLFVLGFLLPYSSIFGMEFAALCRLEKPYLVYILDAIGSLIGALFSLALLIPLIENTIILSLLGFLLILLVPALRFYKIMSVIALLILTISLIIDLPGILRSKIIHNRFPQASLIKHTVSHYGSYTLLNNQGEYIVLHDNNPTRHIANKYNAERLAHIPLIFNKNPRRILVLEGMGTGIEEQLCKYPGLQIDILIIDKKLGDLFSKFLPESITNCYKNDKVNLIISDPRNYLKKTKTKYDVIINLSGQPMNLQNNRLYTVEFFQIALESLNKEGILVFPITGSSSYFSKYHIKYIASLRKTAKLIFKNISYWVDDEIFIVAGNGRISQSVEEIVANWHPEIDNNEYIMRENISAYINDIRTNELIGKLNMEKGEINRDNKPVTVLLASIYWNTLWENNLFIENTIHELIGKKILDYLMICLLLVLFLISLITFNPNRDFNVIALFTMACISYELIFILLFQSLHAALYYYISGLYIIFMLGLITGGMIKNLVTLSIKSNYLFSIMILILMVFMLGFCISNILSEYIWGKILIGLLLFLLGISNGSLFISVSQNHSEKTAIVWTYDYLGSTIGVVLYTMSLITGFSNLAMYLLILNILFLIICIIKKKS